MRLLVNTKRILTNKHFMVLLISILFILLSLTVMMARAYMYSPYSTDDVAQQTLLQEAVIGDGYDVRATASDYTLKFPFYILVNSLLPNTNFTIFLTNLSLLLAGIFLTIVAFLLLRRSVAYSILTLFTLMAAFTVVHASSGAAINPNYRNIEIGLSFIIAALSLAYLHKGAPDLKALKNRWIAGGVIILSSIVLGFFWFSDPMFIYYTALPLAIASAAQLIWINSNRKAQMRAGLLLLILALSYLAYQIWIPLFANMFEWSANPTLGSLISLSTLLPTLEKSFYAYLALGAGGANIVTLDPLSLRFLRSILGIALVTIGLICSAALLTLELLRNKKRSNIVVVFFSSLPFMMLGIFVASGTVVDNASMRYLVLIPFTTALNMAILVAYVNKKYFTYGLAALALLTYITVISMTVHSITRAPDPKPNEIDFQVLSLLESEGLDKGYAASGMSLYYNFISDNTINVVSTFCSPERIGIFYVLIDEANIHAPADETFYLSYPGSISNRCSREDIIEHIGQPTRIINGPDNIDILIYDRDILRDISQSTGTTG